ncbi:MAG TPA: hypothetical protein PKA76_17715 [Pirellulaceae bacterium]|nr:hypothetical protein [Pirellulaceae bacterium]HMP71191.1 hypothetical protein [Pirellulaceae bacterium]
MFSSRIQFLLLQIRDADDPMLVQELDTFCASLGCERDNFFAANILLQNPQPSQIRAADVVIIGGSGDYSAAVESPWLDRVCELLRDLHAMQKPLFGSCWGFQAQGQRI